MVSFIIPPGLRLGRHGHVAPLLGQGIGLFGYMSKFYYL